jgi:two-component system cell cycle response regulator CtrA
MRQPTAGLFDYEDLGAVEINGQSAPVAIAHSSNDLTIQTGKLAVNLDTRIVTVGDQPIHLTGKEYGILELLSLRMGTVLTKEMLLNHLYRGVDEPEIRIVDVFICKMRKKLGQATDGDHYIATVWGGGYVLRELAAAPATKQTQPREESARRHPADGS